jgi:hypothetical protein
MNDNDTEGRYRNAARRLLKIQGDLQWTWQSYDMSVNKSKEKAPLKAALTAAESKKLTTFSNFTGLKKTPRDITLEDYEATREVALAAFRLSEGMAISSILSAPVFKDDEWIPDGPEDLIIACSLVLYALLYYDGQNTENPRVDQALERVYFESGFTISTLLWCGVERSDRKGQLGSMPKKGYVTRDEIIEESRKYKTSKGRNLARQVKQSLEKSERGKECPRKVYGLDRIRQILESRSNELK